MERSVEIYDGIASKMDNVKGHCVTGEVMEGTLGYSDRLDMWVVAWEDGEETLVLDPKLLFFNQSPF